MKHEFPALYAKVSTTIATPLLAITMLLYVQRVITKPAAEVYPVGMAAFGITAALSGIGFTMAPSSADSSTIHYAGEKFLHSSLLLIQSLFVVYIKDSLVNSEWVRTNGTAMMLLAWLAGGITLLVASAAAWSWYYGFAGLNAELWKNWERRIREINSAQERTKEGPSTNCKDEEAP